MSLETVAAELLDALDRHALIDPITARDPGFGLAAALITAALPVRAGETWSTELSGLELDGLRLTLR